MVIRYLTHPQVAIDPAVPVPDWGLSDAGRARVAAVAGASSLPGTTRIVSSAERKARETAAPIAERLGIAVEIRPAMHENDRSATGFLPPEEFERVADAFFARPDASIRGWEIARAAQERIVAEFRHAIQDLTGDVLIVGHGGVGTLLWCALAGKPIDRRHDQGPGGGGNVFAVDPATLRPVSTWQPMETLIG